MALAFFAVAAGLLYFLWKVFGPYFVSSPLDNLPGPPSGSWLIGNLGIFRLRNGHKIMERYADTYGPIIVFRRFFARRMILVHDPRALHTMMVKDLESFPKRVGPSDFMKLSLGPSVLTTIGVQHKRQRKMLNPVFSAAHLRNMTDIFYRVSHKLNHELQKLIPSDGSAKEIDIGGWMGRTTLEMLGQAGFGYSFDDFSESASDEFGECLKLFFPTLSRIAGPIAMMVREVSSIMSEPLIRSIFRSIPHKGTNDMMRITDLMERRSREIIAEKRAALEKGDAALVHEVGEGKDIMSICLKANTAAAENERMTDEELYAQVSTFVLAGMDTTSNALSCIFHLLAQHPDAQEKLRAEVLEARGDDRADIPYDDLVKLPYMDAVCRETLRLHPPVRIAPRMTAKDFVLPLSQPTRGRDGREITEVIVPRGTFVQMHYWASNNDKTIWGEDAREWKPERWLAPLPAAVEDARIPGVYGNLMTFAAGSHACIGFKFSQLEMKILIAELLSSFKFELSDTPVFWNQAPVMYPSMGDPMSKPELRLKLKALKV